MSGTQLVLAPVVAVIAVTAVAGGVAYVQSREEKARIRGVREWADAQDWTFAAGDLQAPWLDRVGRPDFRLGVLLEGRIDGRDAAIGEGSYTVRKPVGAVAGIGAGAAAGAAADAAPGAGADAGGRTGAAEAGSGAAGAGTGPAGVGRSEAVTYHLTVLTVRIGDGAADMEVRERGLGAKLMGSLAGTPTDADAFDARFEIEPAEARARLSDEAVQAHLDSEVPAWSLRDGVVMTVLPGRTRPQDLDGHIALLRRLAEIV
ncbi:hypothetical protein [Actinomadura gamaensis]|uniref:Secreted protein n=1 Tax=Actinomadura gamaensis TaxID=1763541 RepID=A0ABV9U1X7_9ACTN